MSFDSAKTHLLSIFSSMRLQSSFVPSGISPWITLKGAPSSGAGCGPICSRCDAIHEVPQATRTWRAASETMSAPCEHAGEEGTASAYNIPLAYYGLDAPGLTNEGIAIPVVEGRDCDPPFVVVLSGSHFTALLPTHHDGLELAQDPASAQRQQWKEESADLHRRCRGSCVDWRWPNSLDLGSGTGSPGEDGDLLQGPLPVPDVRSNRKRTAGSRSRTGSGMGTCGSPRKRPKRGTGTGRGGVDARTYDRIAQRMHLPIKSNIWEPIATTGAYLHLHSGGSPLIYQQHKNSTDPPSSLNPIAPPRSRPSLRSFARWTGRPHPTASAAARGSLAVRSNVRYRQ